MHLCHSVIKQVAVKTDVQMLNACCRQTNLVREVCADRCREFVPEIIIIMMIQGYRLAFASESRPQVEETGIRRDWRRSLSPRENGID